MASRASSPGTATTTGSVEHARPGARGSPPISVVLVTGAASQIGVYLLPLLAHRGDDVIALTRSVERLRAAGPRLERLLPCARWVERDVVLDPEMLEAADTLIHLAPLALLPALIPSFAARGGRRLIAFGTTSRYSKSLSGDRREQQMAARVAQAEAVIVQACAEHGIAWTLFRPTLIYGAGMDRNVSLIAATIRRLGCFPLFGPARGLRQPVHAADLADACRCSLEHPASRNKVYNLGGGEILEYREMVRRIFIVLGRRPCFLPLPLALFRLAMRSISRLPRYRDFNPEMARRMNQDLIFDHTDAMRDFGYAPRPFRPQFDASDGQLV